MTETLGGSFISFVTTDFGRFAGASEDVRPWAPGGCVICDGCMEQHTLQAPMRSVAGAVTLDEGQLGQLAYHIRWSATLAADGHSESAAQHALIAEALLDVLGGEPLRAASSALDLPDVVAKSSQAASTQRAAAVELGLQFVSHFTSDGRYDLADLYQESTRRIAR